MATATHCTLEEFMARPERTDGLKEELIEGEIILSPAAQLSHALVVRRLTRALTPLEDVGFVLLNDSSCILPPESMPIPDLLAVSGPRVKEALRMDSWLEGAPELVIEVKSPRNTKVGLVRKASIYLKAGAEAVWIVNPERHSVSVLTENETTEIRNGETLEFRGVQVAVETLWGEP